MILICMSREQEQITLLIGGQIMGTQIGIKGSQLRHHIHIQIEHSQITRAPHNINILAISIHAGRHSHVITAVAYYIAVCIKYMHSILFSVTDPDMIRASTHSA